MTQSPAPPPQTFILNYCAGELGTRTKVRRVVVVYLLVYAILLSIGALLAVGVTVYAAIGFYQRIWSYRIYLASYRPIHGYPISSTIRLMFDRLCLYPGTYVSLLGLLVVFFTWMAWRSFRRPQPRCVLASACVVPALVGSLIAAVSLIGSALFYGLRYYSPRPTPACLYLLIPGLLCILLILLLWDLITCLRWIDRNPVTEMAPRSFV